MTWNSEEWADFEQLPEDIKWALYGSVVNHKPSTILQIYRSTQDKIHTLRQIQVKDNNSIQFLNLKYMLMYNKELPHVAANASIMTYKNVR